MWLGLFIMMMVLFDLVDLDSDLPFMPRDVTPWFTALSAYSICTSLPLGEKVVSEKEYLSAMAEFVIDEYGL